MVLDALGQAWRAWAELGASLDDGQWERPTRLEGWTVRHVFAHYAAAPPVLKMIPEGLHGAPDFPDAESLLAHMQRPGGVAHSRAEDIKQEAISLGADRSTGDMVAQFDVVGPEVLADLRGRDLELAMDYGALGTVPIAEALRLPLMEAVVHYCDMAAALELEVPGPLAGEPVRDAVRLLAGTADPIAFLDLATGRGTPQVFPVLR